MAVYYDPGRYIGRVTNHVMGKTKNGNKQFVLSFEVLNRVDPTDKENLLAVGACYERTVFRVITDNTIDYVLQDLESLGFSGGPGAKWEHLDVNAGHWNLVGRDIEVSCTHEEYNGKEVERWSLASDRKLSHTPLAADDYADLDARHGEALRALASTVQDQLAAGDIPEGEVPF